MKFEQLLDNYVSAVINHERISSDASFYHRMNERGVLLRYVNAMFNEAPTYDHTNTDRAKVYDVDCNEEITNVISITGDSLLRYNVGYESTETIHFTKIHALGSPPILFHCYGRL